MPAGESPHLFSSHHQPPGKGKLKYTTNGKQKYNGNGKQKYTSKGKQKYHIQGEQNSLFWETPVGF